MKKLIILILTLGLSYTIQAQTKWFKAVELAVKIENGNWSDWENVNINVKFDLSNDIIIIYSKETQVYKVIEQLPDPYDSDGTQIKFKVVDQDYDIGYLRLRQQYNGVSQIYVDFSDISWVYNINSI